MPPLLLGADPGPDAGGWHEEKTAGIEEAAAALPDATVEWMRGDHDLHAQHPVAVAQLLTELAACVEDA